MIKRLKVLVVDRSPLVAPRIKDLLIEQKENILIGEARNADEALNLFNFIPFDYVLLDLPFRESTALLMEIKEKYSAKVVMFTNRIEPEYRDLCMQLGADYFVDKSSEFTLLKEVLVKDLLIAA